MLLYGTHIWIRKEIFNMGKIKRHCNEMISATREHLAKYGHLFLHLKSCPTIVRKNIMVGNVLLDMYANCGGLTQAQEFFSGFLVRTTMDIWLSNVMLKLGLKPDATTFTCNILCNSGLF